MAKYAIFLGLFSIYFRLIFCQVSIFEKTEFAADNDCPYHPYPQHFDSAKVDKITTALNWTEQYIKSLVDVNTRPAVSANVLYRGKIIWEGNFGQVSRTNPTPITSDTIFRIASISKIFPTLFLYKLWEEGELNLNDPVTKFAPNFRVQRPFGSTVDLTLHDIASQISGLQGFLPFDLLKRDYFAWNGTLEQTLDLIAGQILIFKPRSTCHYSNLAYALLGHILERNFTGDNNLETWLQKNVVKLLSLENTGFELTDEIKSNMAIGYLPSGQKADLMDLNWFRPAGNYYSSASDLAKLSQSLLGYGTNLLGKETLQEMLRPVLKCGYGYLSEITGSPWEINEQQTYLVVRKDGDIEGYSSTMAMVPNLGLTFNLLMSGSRPEDVAGKVLDELVPVFVDQLRSLPRTLNEVPSHDNTNKYTGFYQIDQIQFWNITTDKNTLVMTNPNAPESPFKTVGLSYVKEGVLQMLFLGGGYPCVIGQTNLEIQNGQLLHFSKLSDGKFQQFDFPSLNIFYFTRSP